MAPRKTAQERDRINARIRLARLVSRSARLDILESLLADRNLNRATLQVFARAEYSRGFSAGVRDATDED